MKIKYTYAVEAKLEAIHFFQARSGMKGRPQAPKKRFRLGAVLSVNPEATIEAFSTIAAGENLFTIGAFSSVASALPPYATVGRFCSVAPGVRVMGFKHPVQAVCQSSAVFNFSREFVHAYLEKSFASGDLKARPPRVPTPQPPRILHLGHDVWIGENCTIAPNVSIGNGAIVASGSHVVKDVPPYAIVGGNPAKLIRYRFPTEICEELSRTRWWDYELSDLFSNDVSFADPEGFISKFHQVSGHLRPACYPKVMGHELGTESAFRGLITCHGTILRMQDGNFCHDMNFAIEQGIVSPDELRQTATVEQNEDGTVSLHLPGGYLSARRDGTTKLSRQKDAWERFRTAA